MKALTFLAMTGVVLIGTPALTEQSSCGTAIQMLESGDNAQVRTLRSYVLDVMENLDEHHARAGERSTMALLSDRGRENMVPATTV